MLEHTVTLTDLKQNLGEFIKRAAYRGERIVLLAHGKPRAALISIEDLEFLQSMEKGQDKNKEQQFKLLEELTALRKQMEAEGLEVDSVTTLNEIRAERVDELMGLS